MLRITCSERTLRSQGSGWDTEEGSHRCALLILPLVLLKQTHTVLLLHLGRDTRCLVSQGLVTFSLNGNMHVLVRCRGLWSDLEEKPICQLIWISRTRYRALGQPQPNTGTAEPGHLAFACQRRHCTQQQSQTGSPFRSLPALEMWESSFFPQSRGSQPGADGIFILLTDNMAAQQCQGDGVSKAASSK